ncbi:MAG: peptidoglycan-binding protein [Candidatus Omnitrophica bacterium]|nr:peptidoglycan-binding protein [Candidatus Omnitrophota bacterium]
MYYRLIMVCIAGLALAGCATTAQPKVSPVNQLQNQVVDLQQRMEEQEKEVVNLKYEVKDLTGKVETQPGEEAQDSETVKVKGKAKVSGAKVVQGEQPSFIKVGVSVAEVQKALKGAGLYEGTIDGKVGSKTRSAIIEFQKQHGLKSDGVIGQKTWNELKTYLSE